MHLACKLFSSTLKWEHFQWPHESYTMFSPHLLCWTTHHHTLMANICTCGYTWVRVQRQCVLLPCVLCRCDWHLHLTGCYVSSCVTAIITLTHHTAVSASSLSTVLSLCLLAAFQGHWLRLLRLLDIDWNSISCYLFNQYADITLWNYFRKWQRELPHITGS